MKRIHLKLRSKIMLVNSGPIALLIILGLVAYFNIKDIVATSSWVDHTNEVLRDSTGIVASATDMETGMRGYLLAGRDAFLEPYRTGSEAVEQQITALQRTVSDNPPQVAKLEEARATLIEWRSEVVEPMIALRSEIGDAETMNDLAKRISKAEGKAYFDRFRAQVSEFVSRETVLLEQRGRATAEVDEHIAQSLSSLDEASTWVVHTHDVITKAKQLLLLAVDMETGMRGYLLTGQSVFLEPYEAGQASFFEVAEVLGETVDDNPAQVARVREIAGTMSTWLEQVATPALALRRQANQRLIPEAAVSERVARQEGKAHFDGLRAQVADFVDVEVALLEKRRADASNARRQIDELSRQQAESRAWVTHTHEVIDRANKLLASAIDMETGMRGYLLAGDESFLEPFEAGSAAFDAATTELKTLVSDNQAQVKLLDEIAGTIGDWRSNVVMPNIELRRKIGDAKTMDDMADLVGEAKGKQYFDRFRGLLKEFQAEEAALMELRKARNEETVSATSTTIVGCVVGAVLLGLMLGLTMTRDITRRMSLVLARARSIAEGDLAQAPIEVRGRDEVDQLMLASNEMSANLRTLIDSVKTTVDDVLVCARSASQASDGTAAAMEEQATRVGNIAATIEELSVAVQEVSSHSADVSEFARESEQEAKQGGNLVLNASAEMQQLSRVVNDGAETVDELSAHSEQIGNVITIINSVAEQTNLLALNAAIEAARAGDAGRGFAVVSDEVRGLATRTTSATAEVEEAVKAIQSQTEQAVERMKTGAERVTVGEKSTSEAGDALSKIVSRTQEVSSRLEMVADAVAQQSAAVDDIARNVQEISTAADATVSASTEAQEVAGQLSRNAESLSSAVSRFRV